MSSLPVPRLFWFLLWEGVLTFQENPTYLREEPRQMIYFKGVIFLEAVILSFEINGVLKKNNFKKFYLPGSV